MNTSLVAGLYEIYFDVSLAENSNAALINMGAYFSAGVPSSAAGIGGGYGLFTVTPQFESMAPLLANTTGWTRIGGMFAAQGGETHVIIGIFRDPSLSTDGFTQTQVSSTNQYSAYYYVDNVCVDVLGGECLPPLAIEKLSLMGRRKEKSIFLEWNHDEIQNFSEILLERSFGNNFEEIFSFNPDSGVVVYNDLESFLNNDFKIYRLKGINETGEVTYSNMVTFKRRELNTSSVFPNPFHDKIHFALAGTSGDVSLSLFDMQGKLVREKQLQNILEGTLNDLDGLEQGHYILKLQRKGGVETFKLQQQ